MEIRGVSLAKYKLLDINNYTEEELLKEKGTIEMAMLIERTKDSEETIEILNKILQQKLGKEEKKFLKEVLKTTLQKKIGKEKTEEMLEKMNIGKGEKEMVIEKLERIFDDKYNKGVKDRNSVWNAESN